MSNVQKIQPTGIFTNYIFKAIPLAFDESMSYYETLCALLDYLETTTEVVNNNAELLAELESYVKNYFDDLDIQEEINNKLDEMAESGELAEIISDYATQKVDYIEITNESQSDIQDIFNIDRAKIIVFKNNVTFTQTMRLNKNTTLDLNGYTLTFDIPSVTEDWTLSHGFYNFKDSDEFLGFNGNSNITIQNGTIIGGNASFIHANNINFKNLYFKNCQNNHVLEMCAINNLLVDSCIFEGVPADSDLFSEMIQFDNCYYDNFPFFSDSTNPTYDGTVGANFTIKNCTFKKPTNTNYHFAKAIGMHSYIDNEIFNNITIENCSFNDMLNMAMEIINGNNIIIKNNKFYKNGYTTDVYGAMIRTRQVSSNMLIENNVFNGNIRAIENSSNYVDTSNIVINNNLFKNYKYTSQEEYPIIVLFDNKNCIIKNNTFEDFTQNAIRVNGSDGQNDYSIYSYIIENNIFRPLNDYSLYMIKAYNGNCYINNNIFDADNFNFTNGHGIVTDNTSHFIKLYAKNNQFSNNIVISFNDIWDRKLSNDYYDVYNVLKIAYAGNATSETNKTPNRVFSHFNRLMLTVGDGSHTQSIKLATFSPEQKLDARTFSIPTISPTDNTLQVSSLTINSDGTFNWSGVPLRSIYVYNE